MSTRQLISEDGRVRRYRVLNDAGQQIGTDEETIPTPEMANAATMRSRLQQALSANATHLAKTTTTNAENTAHLRRVTQQNSALIRLMLELLDTADGT